MAAYDPPAVLCAVAAQTERIRLCTGILIPHLRNPIHLAQAWATLNEVSEGRPILCAGAGGGKGTIHKRQYGALTAMRRGAAFDPDLFYRRRARHFAECIEVLSRLWREDKVSHHGEFYDFDEMTLGHARPANPLPLIVAAGMFIPKEQQGAHFPIWNEEVAGKFIVGERATKAMIDHSDGWLTNHCHPEEVKEHYDTMMETAQGKYPGRKYAIGLNCFMNLDDDNRKAWQGVKSHLEDFHGPPIPDDLVDRWGAWGNGEEVAERINSYIDVGVSFFQLVIANPDQFGMMKRIADEVLPRLKGK
jgi:alkanesulfonate monooxygenase SsuD/methylene tetrahydromethanopterin reductase-like flavin-dependent oxidoreductase (luciferase family)